MPLIISSWSNYIPFILIPFIGWGVRRMLIKKNQYSGLKKITFTIGIIAFFLTEMARSFYRPFIYKNDLYDYHIADTIGNSLGTITAIFMILTLSGKGNKEDWKICIILLFGLIGYEFLNLKSTHQIDYLDIMATIIFGFVSVVVYFYLLKKYGNQNQQLLENFSTIQNRNIHSTPKPQSTKNSAIHSP